MDDALVQSLAVTSVPEPYTWTKVRKAVPDWASNLIMGGYRGSYAHGTTIEGPNATDDIDVFGVFVQPVDWYLGLDGYGNVKRHQVYETAGDELDILVYDIRKFFHLLIKGNPNVHSWLWTSPSHLLRQTLVSARILAVRERFMSVRMLSALEGYARSQRVRMQGTEHRGYMGERRKALEAKYGYDIKNAAHCIRILWLAIELAQDGAMHALRPPYEQQTLREIKQGLWSLDSVLELHGDLLETLGPLARNANLPEQVDHEWLNDFLVDIIRLSQPGGEFVQDEGALDNSRT